MLGKRRSRAMQSNPCKPGLMIEEKPTIKLAQIFSSISEPDGSKSPTSPLEFNRNTNNIGRSPRTWKKRDCEGIGLGIVAAMNKNNDTHDAFFSCKSSRAAKLAGPVSRHPQISPRSEPIPIVSAPKFRGPRLGNNDVDELSESYTCVISHHGPNSIRKQQYFADEFGGDFVCKNSCNTGGVIFESTPPKIAEIAAKIAAFQPAEFLRSCYLCRRKLHGRDIFMYRGEKAFCSEECRCQQIMSDEHKEKCGAEALKTFDYSGSPCSAPRLFSTGVAAA